MSTELSNGVIIPEEYSDDWYDEMSINLRKLNDVITAASDNATDIQRLDTDKANQSDLTALTSRVYQNETDIIALQTAVSGALKREIVQTLPTEDISTTTIYMIRNSESSGTNIYDEYMYINSQWELIGTSATDFSNYYTKNETDNLLSGKVDNSTLGSYYTKTESDNLLSAKANQTDLTSLSGRVTQNETDITALQTAVSGALKREIVQSLPTQDISTTTIYMIRNTTTSGDNIYDEYMYINNLWELIGTSATDFSNYYTKTEIDTLLSDKANDSDVVHKSGNETISGVKSFINYFLGKDLSGQTVNLNDCVDAYGGAIHYYYAVSNYTNISNKPENKPFILESKTVRYVSSIDYIYYQKIYTADYNASPSIYTRYYRSGSASWSNWIKDTDKFVTTNTNQTITATKTFDGVDINFKSNDAEYSVTSGSKDIFFLDKNSTRLAYFRQGVYSSGLSYQTFNILGYDSNNQQVSQSITFGSGNLGLSTAFLRANTDNAIALGRSNTKWSDVQTYKVNNLEPSSLSLPSGTLSNQIDIRSYFANTGTGDTNSYTALANGWIYLRLGSIDSCQATVYDANNNKMWGQSSTGSDEQITIPILKGQTLSTQWNTSSTVYVDTAKFIPCQGNI